MQTGKKNGYGWVIWFVGLPGSGKSTYAESICQVLKAREENVCRLSMDNRRKAYFPDPKYTDEERVRAYRLFAEEAAEIASGGVNVIMDGTAPKLFMREYARALVPRFAEVYIRCSLATAMQRERDRPEGLVMANLYGKALQRQKTGVAFEGLGEVVGVDTPFEENPFAECVIDSENDSIESGCKRVLDFLERWC